MKNKQGMTFHLHNQSSSISCLLSQLITEKYALGLQYYRRQMHTFIKKFSRLTAIKKKNFNLSKVKVRLGFALVLYLIYCLYMYIIYVLYRNQVKPQNRTTIFNYSETSTSSMFVLFDVRYSIFKQITITIDDQGQGQG